MEWKNVGIGQDSFRSSALKGRVLSMHIDIKTINEGALIIRLAEDEIYHTDIIIDTHNNAVTMDRTNTGNIGDQHKRKTVSFDENANDKRCGIQTVDIFMDRYSAELFINSGRYAMSTLIFTKETADGISILMSAGTAIIDITKNSITL